MKLVFEKEKETKNKIKYQEQDAENRGPIIGTLYVEKWFAKGRNVITINIEED